MADSTATTNNLQITKDRVKSWAACSDGYRWFLGKFPEGAEFVPVYRALIAEKRGDDADWLVGKLFDELDTTTRVKQTAIIAGADAVAIAAQVASGAEAATTGYRANAATTGEGANAATTGYRANAATTGNWANAATTGEGANAATTGEGANAATTGNWANAATTGEGANAATTGNWANAATTGKHAVAAALGIDAKAKASAGGAIVLTHRNDDGDLICIRAAMVGQDGIKPDVWYELSADGEFVESEV